MDESSVKLDPQRREKGFVAVRSSGEKATAKEKRLHMTLAERRACLTLVAFIADSLPWQRQLPQFIIGNEHVLPKSWTKGFVQGCGNLFVLRRKSSWVTQQVLVSMLKTVAAALRRTSLSPFIVLSMDTCPVHLTETVARACARMQVHLHLIPANTTRFLQPLDVQVFAEFKLRLSQRFHAAITASNSGRLSRAEYMDLLCDVVRVTFTKDWSRAFRRTGFWMDRLGLSASLLRAMNVPSAPAVEVSLPTLADLQAVYPRRRQIPVEDVFAILLRRPAVARRRRAAASTASGESSRSLPLNLRLRSGKAYRALRRAQLLKREEARAPAPSAIPPPCPPPPVHRSSSSTSRLPVGRPLHLRRRTSLTTAISAAVSR